jgi:hypothetical protein
MSMSRAPGTTSLGLSALESFLLKIGRKNTPLLLIVKRRTGELRGASRWMSDNSSLAQCIHNAAQLVKQDE